MEDLPGSEVLFIAVNIAVVVSMQPYRRIVSVEDITYVLSVYWYVEVKV